MPVAAQSIQPVKAETPSPLSQSGLPGFLHLVLLAFLVFSCTFGFFGRYLGKVNNLVDFSAVAVMLLAIGALAIQKDRVISRQERTILWTAALWLLALGVSSVVGNVQRSVVQVVLYLGYLGPLLLLVRLSNQEAYQKYVPVIVLISLAQFPVDWNLPLTGVDPLDAFPGTFQIGNNKSKLLLMVLLFVLMYYRPNRLFRVFLPICVLALGYSIYVGYSNAAYAGMAVALVLGFARKKKAMLLIVSMLLLGASYYLIERYAGEQGALINQERFLNPKYGAWAVYVFGFGALRDSSFVGVGLGDFITRTSQSMGGALLNKVPRTMVTYGDILNDVAAPSGVSSFLNIVVEAGVVGVLISALLVVVLVREQANTRYGATLFYFVLLVALTMPMYFEGPDGMVFVYFYVILSKAMKHLALDRAARELPA